jgi:hypothetical protein
MLEATWGCQCATCEKLRNLDSSSKLPVTQKCAVCGQPLPNLISGVHMCPAWASKPICR